MTATLERPASELGRGRTRYDAEHKTQGKARYAADEPVRNVVHAMLVQSTIARGRVRTLDTAQAEAAPGVLAVLTHHNAPRLHAPPFEFAKGLAPANNVAPLQNDQVQYAGQNVAVVVAETFEEARAATALVRIAYDAQAPSVSLATGTDRFDPPEFMEDPLQYARGDAGAALGRALARVEATYETPVEITTRSNRRRRSLCGTATS